MELREWLFRGLTSLTLCAGIYAQEPAPNAAEPGLKQRLNTVVQRRDGAMIRTARHVHAFENERMLWSWLRQVARSCHVDWLRKNGREPQCVSLTLFSEGAAQEAMEDSEELFAALERSISELDAEESEVLRLAYYEGVTHRNMAEKLNTSAKAIESKLGRIRQKLRRIVLEKMKDYALL